MKDTSSSQLRWRLGMSTIAVLFVVSAVAFGFEAWYKSLPDPSSATKEELFQWLVLRDLESEPVMIQDGIRARLLTELDAGIDFTEVNSSLQESHYPQVRKNLDLILKRWLQELSNDFHTMDKSAQGPYLDQLIVRVEGWGLVPFLATLQPASEPQKQRKLSAFASLSHIADELAIEMPENEKTKLVRFLSAIKLRIFTRSLMKLGGK